MTTPKTPEGWQLVPKEATPEMMTAVDDAYGDGGDFPDMWAAALAAAPAAPSAEGVGSEGVAPADLRAPATLPESMSRDEMLKYYSEYANMVAHEVIGYQRQIRELKAVPAAPTAPAGGEAPVAWAVFADNGNIRVWSRTPIDWAAEKGLAVTPLYTHPSADLRGAAEQALEALKDMNNGWKYIRSSHGDLYGVGWDRAQDKADAAIASLEAAISRKGKTE